MGLFLLLSRDGHRQPCDPLGQSSAALRLHRGDVGPLRDGPRFSQTSAPGQGDLRRAIAAYKRVRDVTQQGNLYRLERPHGAARGALNFVSKDQSRAVVFAFQCRRLARPVHPLGLDPARAYTVRELNPAPGRDALPQEGKTLSGEEIMRAGIAPSCHHALEACAIELAP